LTVTHLNIWSRFPLRLIVSPASKNLTPAVKQLPESASEQDRKDSPSEPEITSKPEGERSPANVT